MHLLDRELQRRILEELAACYPNGTGALHELLGMTTDPEVENELIPNLAYLQEHQLVSSGYQPVDFVSGERSWRNLGRTHITATGLDFLADDGGLSAMLGVVTIKIHDDTLKQLIEAKVNESAIPAAEKKRLTDQLRALPAKAIEHLTLKLIDKGLEQGPATIHWLEAAFRSLS
jgi:hypothetical protein